MRSPDQIGISWEENQLLMQQLREKAALENRRQHNIFEAGDWVVHIFYKDSMLQRIEGVDGNYIYVLSHDESYQYKAYSPDFRHATDAEIKAGKRLGVK